MVDSLEIDATDTFRVWFAGLRDDRARSRIGARVRRLAFGQFGDVKVVGSGISELRIDYGPGYRVYFKRLGSRIVLLLCGGDKSSQVRDIARAKAIAAEVLE